MLPSYNKMGKFSQRKKTRSHRNESVGQHAKSATAKLKPVHPIIPMVVELQCLFSLKCAHFKLQLDRMVGWYAKVITDKTNGGIDCSNVACKKETCVIFVKLW